MPFDPIVSGQLELRAVAADWVAALLAGDADRLEALSGARFARPLVAPPLMDDALPYFAEQLRRAPPPPGFWPWLIVDRVSGAGVGYIGSTPVDGAADTLQVGYSIYPAHEGKGYATAALQALLAWLLARPAVRRVQATIPPWHTASLRVAAKAGMTQTGVGHDDEVGDVLIFTIGA